MNIEINIRESEPLKFNVESSFYCIYLFKFLNVCFSFYYASYLEQEFWLAHFIFPSPVSLLCIYLFYTEKKAAYSWAVFHIFIIQQALIIQTVVPFHLLLELSIMRSTWIMEILPYVLRITLLLNNDDLGLIAVILGYFLRFYPLLQIIYQWVKVECFLHARYAKYWSNRRTMLLDNL